MSRGRQAGLAGGLLAVAAAGAAAGIKIERRLVGRSGHGTDTPAGMPLGDAVRGSRYIVDTPDGVALAAVVGGTPTAELTVVFVHGFSLNSCCWHFQWAALEHGRPPVRLVAYDQRGHGRSTRGAPDTATIDQLGRDLSLVLSQLVPAGPVVLVGHSMGGMTIMALADQEPELFGDRVVGVALLSTSSGRMGSVTFGLPGTLVAGVRRVIPGAIPLLRRQARLVERARRMGSDLSFVATRRWSFGSPEVSASLVTFMESMIATLPVEVFADFLGTFSDHDKLAALPVLRPVPVLVLAGGRDLLTPIDHTRAIAAELPDAELVEIPGAGHAVMLECPEAVSDRLLVLVRAAARRIRTPA